MALSDDKVVVQRRRRAPPCKIIAIASLLSSTFPAYSVRQSQINLNRPKNPRQKQESHNNHGPNQTHRRKLAGAFNPALTAFDPNSPEYAHKDPGLALGAATTGGLSTADALASPQDYGAPEDWVQCPPSYEGNRASYDCTAYIMCSKGEMSGEYQSCLGLKFDNTRGVCDWGEDVMCEGLQDGNSTSLVGEEGGGTTYSGDMETATAFRPMSGSWQAEEDSGKPDEVAAWNGGSDWGGSWVEGVWVPDGEQPSKPAQKPAEPPSETAWVDQAWDPSQITSYPHLPLTELDQFLALDPKKNNRTKVPRVFKSKEGWSVASRKEKTLVGYYASWQWYANSERSKPSNMKFQKVDRVNYAFFQTNPDGDIWGTDPWADPILLFGPTDWMITIQPELDYAPQFNDDNGFDDSIGENFNYIGAKYVDVGPGVFCHRSSPKGKRDCKGHIESQGLIGAAHSQGAQVYISIGGWSLSDAFPEMAGNAAARRNFAKNCVGLIREYGIDGIDIDWEFPGYEPHHGTSSDKQNFILLLKDIRAALDAYQKVAYPNGEKTIGVTAALPCVPPIIDSQDVAQISSIVTEMNLMTFDFHGTWNDQVGVNSPLFDQDPRQFESPEYSVDGCVQRWIKEGADPDKINIGLPFYGRSFGSSTKLYSSHSGADDIHWWEDKGKPQYHAILEKLPEMISLRDNVTKTQFAYFDDDKGGLVSYDDNQAICDKVEYALTKDLHGYIIWDLTGDLTESFATPLLDVVNIKLDQGDGFDCSLLRAETRGENGEVISQQNTEPNPWYANWETGSCVNDGKQSSWEKEENLFRFKAECCSYKFEYKFDECLGPATYEPTDDPTYSPSQSPIQALSQTDYPTHVYGAAQVVTDPEAKRDGLDPIDNSIIPTASTTRLTEETSEGGPEPPVTWCFGGCKNANEKCVGNQNNPQTIDDETCASCLDGQTFWPCDVDGLCFCWDPDTPRIPPAPASGKAQLSDERPCDYFTEDMYNQLGPEAQFPYTYEGLCLAIDHYNDGHAEKIFMMGTEDEKRKELAAFLGHTLHESDEWKAGREYLICADNKLVGDETWCKPCTADEFDWETFKCTGVGLAGGGLTFNGYCDYVIQPPLACPCNDTLVGDADGYIPASASFFGRGAIQLSWNYNFRAASEALTSNAETFCHDPDLVATTPEYAWGAGVFFWMENLKEETTCHIEALKHHDFGGTLNNINGGLECPAYHGGWHGEAVKLRLNRYCRATATLGLDSIMSMGGCKGLNASFAECLGDGTCPDCEQFSDGIEPSTSELTDDSTSTVVEDVDNSTLVIVSDDVDNSTVVNPESTPATTVSAAYTFPSNSTTNAVSTASSDTTTNGTSMTDSVVTTNATVTANIASSSPSPSAINVAFTTALPTATAVASAIVTTTTTTTIDAAATDITSTAIVSTSAPALAIDSASTTASATTADSSSMAVSPTTTGAASTSASSISTDIASTTASATNPNAETLDNVSTLATKASGCPDGLHSVDGLPGCCLPEVAYLGDGACDPDAPYNTPECNFDNGDCCRETCNLDSNYGCSNEASQGYGPFGYFCLNPDLEEYIHPDKCTVSDRTRVGDGRCDADLEMYNTADCNWDGGDCCEQSCNPRYAYFECGDPAFPYDCKNENLAKLEITTTTTVPETSIVSSSSVSTTEASINSSTSTVTTYTPSTSPDVLPSLKVTVEASQDATIMKNDPDTPYGSEDKLQIRGVSFGPNAQDVIVRFVVPSSDSNPINAVMRLYALSNSPSGGIFHIAPESDAWSDKTVTWRSAPDYAGRLGNLGEVEKDKWYEIDVTNAVKDLDRKRGPITVRIRSRDTGTTDFSSREGGHTPELVISYPLESDAIPEPVVIVTDPTSFAESLAKEPTKQDFTTSNIVNVASNVVYIDTDEYTNSGDGSYYFPVWDSGGTAVCSNGEPPSWAMGPYLKKTKKQCCDSYFILQKNECLNS